MGLKTFATESCLEVSETEMLQWKSGKPKTPGIGFLIKAKKLIETEKDFALSLGNDKTAHCYLGCRINEDINFETAKFTAWQKEFNDATDCNPNTYFDVEDYAATIKGTEAPKGSCVSYCQSESYFGNRL